MAENSDDEDRWQGRKRRQVEFKWSREHNELEELRRVVATQGTRLGRLVSLYWYLFSMEGKPDM
jgi:hypothetical protein